MEIGEWCGDGWCGDRGVVWIEGKCGDRGSGVEMVGVEIVVWR